MGNPVDMIASATAEQYARSLSLLAHDSNIDAVVVIFIPPLVTRPEDVADALVQAAAELPDKTVVACILGVNGIHERLRGQGMVIPSFAFPEAAARALGRVARYAQWQKRPEGTIPDLEDVDRSRSGHLASSLLASGERWLDQESVQKLLRHYRVKTTHTILVPTPQEVEQAAAVIGGTLGLKVDSRTLLHKTDVGGVRLGLKSADEAAKQLSRSTPCVDVDEMLRSLKAWPLFEGYRGQPPLDLKALRSLLFRVSAMVEDLPHIAELDLNPVLVGRAGAGCIVLAARIRMTTPQPRKPLGARTT